jgi:hypothetical protein
MSSAEYMEFVLAQDDDDDDCGDDCSH